MSDDAALTLDAGRACPSGVQTRATAPHAHAPSPWLDPELLSVIATFILMLLGKFGWTLGLPAALAPWFFLAAYLTGGWHGTIHGVRSLLRGTVDIDLLMILAALGAAYVHHAFEGAMLLFLFSLSHALQEMAIEKSRSAITALMKLRPDVALCKRGAETALIAIDQLVVGDIVVLRPGESIPVDGVVTEGMSTVNQASITGESLPVAWKCARPSWRANRRWQNSSKWWNTPKAKKRPRSGFSRRPSNITRSA
jgi:Cd2+/Zn2+-exporting ATPase